MREIKFRVWVKPEHWNETENKGLMTNGLPLGGFDKWWLNLDDPFSDNCSLDGEFIVGEQIEIMQFTGLKDKNGRKIFEGDIIKYQNQNYEMRFYVPHFSILTADGYILNSTDFEVIGNIYENPELVSNSNSN